MNPEPHPLQFSVLGFSILAAVLALAAWFGVLLNRRGGRPDESARDSPLVPDGLVAFVYRLLTPLVEAIARLRIRPNHVTAGSLVLAALTGLAIGTGYTAVGCLLLVVTGVGDLIDGHLARLADSGSRAGAFFDSFADRVAESFVFGGLAYHGGGGALTWLSIWALVASLLISYARARAEGLGLEGAVGLMQRPERMALLTVTLLLASLAPLWATIDGARATLRTEAIGVALLAVLSTITAIRRARWSFEALRE